jgi:DNA polymerase-3 subunit delta'
VHADQRLGRRSIADRIVRLAVDGRAGQPLLFAGPAGSGKEITALGIARRLNCRVPDSCTAGSPCESCAKAITFQHPDIRWIGPAPASYDDAAQSAKVREVFAAKQANPFADIGLGGTSQIVIGNPEQPGPLSVRGLLQFLRRQSFQGAWKVAIVADAHRLNVAAANAFLKTLEEPPPDSLIILLTSRPSSLLSTVRSRCQKVPFEPYPDDRVDDIVAALKPEVAAETRAEVVRLAAGDARRAFALLQPELRAVQDWAASVFLELHEGRAAAGHLAAECLNAGVLPVAVEGDEVGTEGGKPGKGDKGGKGGKSKKGARSTDATQRRRRALAFCEALIVLTAETLACREQGADWRPRLATRAAQVRALAPRRRARGLLADLARIERAKHEIDGNLNLGLVMAGLCEDLGDHVRRDQLTASA